MKGNQECFVELYDQEEDHDCRITEIAIADALWGAVRAVIGENFCDHNTSELVVDRLLSSELLEEIAAESLDLLRDHIRHIIELEQQAIYH